MSVVEKRRNEICGRRKREKSREKLIQTPFRNPHGVTEMRTRDLSGGRLASNSLHHGAIGQVNQIKYLDNIASYKNE